MNMKVFSKYLISLLFVFILGLTNLLAAIPYNNEADLDRDLIRTRLESIQTLVDADKADMILPFLQQYLLKYPAYTQMLIGRRVLYFPIFEKELAANDLPLDLKYMTIIESSLRPDARSRAGAIGLWQFMPGTAKLNGLKINQLVDERKDPIRSTEAAAKQIKHLYDYYQDWQLVLAAYNCGPGNVNKAIKRANSVNYWDIRPYLPSETQDYVPKFLAATYLFKFYSLHELMPQFPDLDLQITGTVKVHDELTFSQIKDWTNLDINVIRTLNPGFRKDLVPANYDGYQIILPKRVIPLVEESLGGTDEADKQEENNFYRESNYKEVEFQALKGDDLTDIASHFEINDYNIRYWNELPTNTIEKDQMLVLYILQHPEQEVRMPYRINRTIAVMSVIPTRDLSVNASLANNLVKAINQSQTPVVLPVTKHADVFRNKYVVQKGESLLDIIHRFPQLSLAKLMEINQLKSFDQVQPGFALLIE